MTSVSQDSRVRDPCLPGFLRPAQTFHAHSSHVDTFHRSGRRAGRLHGGDSAPGRSAARGDRASRVSAHDAGVFCLRVPARFIATHLPAYLQLCGVAPGVSAWALGLIGLFNAGGTWTFGQLAAPYSQKRLLAMIYLLRTLFIVAFVSAPITATSTSCSPRQWACCGWEYHRW